MKQLSSKIVYNNPWMRVREDEIELLDGSHSLYGVIERNDYVVVMAREGDGFWFVEQFRYPLQHRSLELPQGSWPPGKGSEVTPASIEALAHAELSEETGLRAERLELIGSVYQSVGSSAQKYHVFLATGLSQGETALEPSELGLTSRVVSDAELAALISTGSSWTPRRWQRSRCIATRSIQAQSRREWTRIGAYRPDPVVLNGCAVSATECPC